MAIIKVQSVCDIKLPSKEVNKGAFGKIYQYTPRTYFKLISSSQGNLNLDDNIERLEILIKLMNLKKTKYLILPKDIYLTNDTLIGYTSLINKAPILRDVSLDSKYADIMKSFNLLSKDIKVLANMGIFNPDTSPYNLLFAKKMYLLDFDNSIYSNDKVYLRTLHNIFNSIYLSVIKDGFGSPILMESDLESLLQSFKDYQSSNYDLYFELLRWKLECYTRKRINTVGDLRKCLSLTKRG